MRGLAGQAVIVTGGASGIGRATCLRLAEEGCLVGVFDRDAAGAAQTAADCNAGAARGYTVDITDPTAIEAGVVAFEAACSPVEGLAKEGLARAIPLRRLGRADDYPGMIAFLLSDDAAFMTGQTISISGGLTMS